MGPRRKRSQKANLSATQDMPSQAGWWSTSHWSRERVPGPKTEGGLSVHRILTRHVINCMYEPIISSPEQGTYLTYDRLTARHAPLPHAINNHIRLIPQAITRSFPHRNLGWVSWYIIRRKTQNRTQHNTTQTKEIEMPCARTPFVCCLLFRPKEKAVEPLERQPG